MTIKAQIKKHAEGTQAAPPSKSPTNSSRLRAGIPYEPVQPPTGSPQKAINRLLKAAKSQRKASLELDDRAKVSDLVSSGSRTREPIQARSSRPVASQDAQLLKNRQSVRRL